jgi:hypothetical protein
MAFRFISRQRKQKLSSSPRSRSQSPNPGQSLFYPFSRCCRGERSSFHVSCFVPVFRQSRTRRITPQQSKVTDRDRLKLRVCLPLIFSRSKRRSGVIPSPQATMFPKVPNSTFAPNLATTDHILTDMSMEGGTEAEAGENHTE